MLCRTRLVRYLDFWEYKYLSVLLDNATLHFEHHHVGHKHRISGKITFKTCWFSFWCEHCWPGWTIVWVLSSYWFTDNTCIIFPKQICIRRNNTETDSGLDRRSELCEGNAGLRMAKAFWNDNKMVFNYLKSPVATTPRGVTPNLTCKLVFLYSAINDSLNRCS